MFHFECNGDLLLCFCILRHNVCMYYLWIHKILKTIISIWKQNLIFYDQYISCRQRVGRLFVAEHNLMKGVNAYHTHMHLSVKAAPIFTRTFLYQDKNVVTLPPRLHFQIHHYWLMMEQYIAADIGITFC